MAKCSSKHRRIVTIAIITILLSSSSFTVKTVYAQEQPTLAETINKVTSQIQNWNSPWTVFYGQIFSQTNQSSYDTAILQAANQNDSLNVFFIARLAELNGYSSQTINNTLITVLNQNIPSLTLYNRYLPYIYEWALQLNISGWNITQAYNNFNPNWNGWGRYYDEYAQTLSMYLELTKNNLTQSIPNCADIWNNLQLLWNSNADCYNYQNSMPETECEMGNFAQIIVNYFTTINQTIPNTVIEDLQTKLLVNNFNSPGWGTDGVIKHADMNPQLRLVETLSTFTALQMLYPSFSTGNQTNFKNMMLTAWQGLINSPLFFNNSFTFTNDYGESINNDASSVGAMTLFLDGIIPDTGYLIISPINERYQDCRTCFPTSQWQFNYISHSIKIPVTSGNLSFIFGTQQTSYNFTSNGVYTIQFSSDWNSIVLVNKVSNITTSIIQPQANILSSTPLSISQEQTTQSTENVVPKKLSSTQILSLPSITPIPTTIQSIKYSSSNIKSVNNSLIAFFIFIFILISLVIIYKIKPKETSK